MSLLDLHPVGPGRQARRPRRPAADAGAVSRCADGDRRTAASQARDVARCTAGLSCRRTRAPRGPPLQALLASLDRCDRRAGARRRRREATLAAAARRRCSARCRRSSTRCSPRCARSRSARPTLPPTWSRRWKSADGQYRVEIWPKEVLDNPPAMERFIAQRAHAGAGRYRAAGRLRRIRAGRGQGVPPGLPRCRSSPSRCCW